MGRAPVQVLIGTQMRSPNRGLVRPWRTNERASQNAIDPLLEAFAFNDDKLMISNILTANGLEDADNGVVGFRPYTSRDGGTQAQLRLVSPNAPSLFIGAA